MTQKNAIDILKLGYNVFLTGPAGSGKTHLINQYVSYLRDKNIEVGVTASTGVAANHLNGITINSWSGIGIKEKISDDEIQDLLSKRYITQRITKTKALIIDEVSMISKDLFNSIDRICRAVKKNSQPFGGMQVVLSGDFFQLPPVAPDNKRVEFVYKSSTWQELDLKVCYLNRIVRQKDDLLLSTLQEIRRNKVSAESIKLLSSRLYQPMYDYPVLPKLFTHNGSVKAINEQELAKLEGSYYQYVMKHQGNDHLVEALKKSTLAPEKLLIKVGASVMFVKNNRSRGYINGTLGQVVGFNKKRFPIVRITSGKEILANPVEWTVEEEGHVKARVRQIPLTLAWALTIHKSQGMNLDAAEIDLGRPFAPGMGYVALSRVKGIDAIRLLGLNKKAFEVDQEIVVLEERLKQESEKSEELLNSLEWLPKQSLQMMFTANLRKSRKSRYIPASQLPLPMRN